MDEIMLFQLDNKVAGSITCTPAQDSETKKITALFEKVSGRDINVCFIVEWAPTQGFQWDDETHCQMFLAPHHLYLAALAAE